MRLILDPPAAGAWNMAVDEVLLVNAVEQGKPTLRFYQWSEPTLSLGYFQRHADRETHVASRACPLVRRSSGGGAIVHDVELTYSLAVPIDGRKTAAADLYLLMHDTLVAALASLGVSASQLGQGAQTVTVAEPFLCFQRRAPGDVLMDNLKIAGSAQRRRGQAVLQHGSVLLKKSAAAPELPGIADLCGREIAPAELAQAWLRCLHDRGLNTKSPAPLVGWMLEEAARVNREKYGDRAWSLRR